MAENAIGTFQDYRATDSAIFGMMNLLYLCHRIPYPPNKGDKIRSFNEIKYLSKNHTVDLVCLADDPSDLKFVKNLKRYCRKVAVIPLNKTVAKLKGLLGFVAGKAISVGYFYRKGLQAAIDTWLYGTPYHAIICFSSPMAEYVFRSPILFCSNPNKPICSTRAVSCFTGRPQLIMDFCDVDSDKWHQYADKSYFPLSWIYRSEYRRLLAYESSINRDFDHSIFVSKAEAELFCSLLPDAKNIAAIPNGVDTDYFSPDNPEIKPLCFKDSGLNELKQRVSPLLLFTGAMDYHANVDGVVWFSKKVLPLIRKRVPEVHFLIVGSNPVAFVKQLEKLPGITVTGFVEDVRTYYLAADMCVVPLRLARGVQNKVLEAMAMGRPVVCTPAANRGSAAIDGEHLLQAETNEAFAEAVISLVADREKCKRLGENARSFVKTNYKWLKNMSLIEQLLG